LQKEINPIAVFDSGYGGLTILKEIKSLLPEYDYIYLGDNARTPYGTRSFEIVYQYTLQAVKKLFSLNVPLIILACNTASAKALKTIQQKNLEKINPTNRVLGVIKPSIEALQNITKTNHVGILATQGTVHSMSYVLEIKKIHPQIKVVQEACPIWVPLVESDEFDTLGGHYFIKKHLESLLAKDHNIDTIILGCTHYPLLLPIIKKYVPKDIQIISQGKIVASSLKNYMFRHPEMENRCTKNATKKYFTTEAPKVFKEKASIFLQENICVMHLDL